MSLESYSSTKKYSTITWNLNKNIQINEFPSEGTKYYNLKPGKPQKFKNQEQNGHQPQSYITFNQVTQSVETEKKIQRVILQVVEVVDKNLNQVNKVHLNSKSLDKH